SRRRARPGISRSASPSRRAPGSSAASPGPTTSTCTSPPAVATPSPTRRASRRSASCSPTWAPMTPCSAWTRPRSSAARASGRTARRTATRPTSPARAPPPGLRPLRSRRSTSTGSTRACARWRGCACAIPTCRWRSSAAAPVRRCRSRPWPGGCACLRERPAADDQVVPAELGLAVDALPARGQPLHRAAGGVHRGRRPRPPVALKAVAQLDRDRRPEAAQRLELDHLEAGSLEQVAQALRRVAVEVTRVVHRPEEWGGGDQVAARLEQPQALGDRVSRALQVLEHLGQEDGLRLGVGERDRVRGRDHVDDLAALVVLLDVVDAHVLGDVGGEDRLPRLAPAADVDQAAAGVALCRAAQGGLERAVDEPVLGALVGVPEPPGGGRVPVVTAGFDAHLARHPTTGRAARSPRTSSCSPNTFLNISPVRGWLQLGVPPIMERVFAGDRHPPRDGSRPHLTLPDSGNRRGSSMSVRVGINGFGRIGRNVFRAARERASGYEIVAVNDLMDPKIAAHLLRYDTVHGRFAGTVEPGDGKLVVDGKDVRVLSERDPASLPWKDMGVEVVVESTGLFTKREAAS